MIFKRLTIPLIKYAGGFTWHFWGVFSTVLALQASRNVRSSQEIRCMIFAPRKPEGALWVLGAPMHKGSKKVPDMWYPRTGKE